MVGLLTKDLVTSQSADKETRKQNHPVIDADVGRSQFEPYIESQIHSNETKQWEDNRCANETCHTIHLDCFNTRASVENEICDLGTDFLSILTLQWVGIRYAPTTAWFWRLAEMEVPIGPIVCCCSLIPCGHDTDR